MTRQPVWKLNARLLLIALMLLAMGGYLWAHYGYVHDYDEWLETIKHMDSPKRFSLISLNAILGMNLPIFLPF